MDFCLILKKLKNVYNNCLKCCYDKFGNFLKTDKDLDIMDKVIFLAVNLRNDGLFIYLFIYFQTWINCTILLTIQITITNYNIINYTNYNLKGRVFRSYRYSSIRSIWLTN